MSQTISTFKNNLQRKLHGTTLNKVSNVNSLIGEAAGNLLARIDPNETRRTAQITNAIHDSIYDYPAPTDLKGNKVVDIRPQVNRTTADNFHQRFAKSFDLNKKNISEMFQVKNNSGVRTLRLVSSSISSPTTLHTMDSITSNGTWAVGSDATNITRDTVDFISSGSSLNFDLNANVAASTGYIENSTLTDVNLTTHDEQSTLFVWVYLPDTSIITSVSLRWGNDTSNYWSRTATSPHDQSTFKTGWNLVSFAWNGATETGTVDPSAIDYLRVTVAYDGTAETDIKVDNIMSSLGEIFEIEYYSKYLFKNSSGTLIEAPTDDSDTILLDTEAVNILLYETCYLISQEIQGEDAVYDRNFFKTQLNGDATQLGLYRTYSQNNVSEAIKPQSFYYLD